MSERCCKVLPVPTKHLQKEGKTVKNAVTVTKTVAVTTTSGTVELGKDIEQAIALFNDAKEAIRTLEKQKKEAEAIIKEAMGEATIGLIDGVERVKISYTTRTDLDKAKVQEVYPEAYETCLKTTTFPVVKAVSNN